MATFVLPAGYHLKILATGQANYTQAFIIDIYADGIQHVHHRAEFYWSSGEFLLPVHVLGLSATVNIRGEYLYTDTAWGLSAEKIWTSSEDRLVLGYDDSRNWNPDNDYNDLILDIYVVKGSPTRISAKTCFQK